MRDRPPEKTLRVEREAEEEPAELGLACGGSGGGAAGLRLDYRAAWRRGGADGVLLVRTVPRKKANTGELLATL